MYTKNDIITNTILYFSQCFTVSANAPRYRTGVLGHTPGAVLSMYKRFHSHMVIIHCLDGGKIKPELCAQVDPNLGRRSGQRGNANQQVSLVTAS